MLDYLSIEIAKLEDDHNVLEHKILRKYSVDAGIHSISIPNTIVAPESHVRKKLKIANFIL